MRQLRDAEPKPRYADYERVAQQAAPRPAATGAVARDAAGAQLELRGGVGLEGRGEDRLEHVAQGR